jgi:hypothetical protein
MIDFKIENPSQYRSAALESEAGFAAFCRMSSGMEHGPFVRASVYSRVDPKQDIWAYEFGNDPRRPVVMRGASKLMKSRYVRQSEWAVIVTRKYLKKIRFTAFTQAEAWEVQRLVGEHMTRRGHYVHSSIDLIPTPWCQEGQARCWVDGEFRWCTPSEYRRLRKPHLEAAKHAEELRNKNLVRLRKEAADLTRILNGLQGAANDKFGRHRRRSREDAGTVEKARRGQADAH